MSIPLAYLTKEERNAVRALQRLAKRWPKTLALATFGGPGEEISVVLCGADGSLPLVGNEDAGNMGIDQDRCVDVKIGLACAGTDG